MSRDCWSAISQFSELAYLLMTMNLVCLPISIPRQIFEYNVFQLIGDLVSVFNPVSPPGGGGGGGGGLNSYFLLQYIESQ